MPVSKKINTKSRIKTKYAFAISIILIGTLFTIFEIGKDEFSGFPSLGIWMIYIGVITTAIVTMTTMRNKERIIDERMQQIGYKASRITTLIFILTLFFIMILDGIYTLTFRYYLFASFLISFYIFTYVISYKIIEQKS